MKRGVQDGFFLGLMAFAIIIAAFVVYYAVDQSGTAVAAALGNSNFTQMVTNLKTMNANFINALPIGLMIGSLIAIALASFLPIHPVFLPLGIVGLVASVVFMVFLQDAAVTVLADPFFLPFTIQFPTTTAFLEHIALYVFVTCAGLLLASYGRFRMSQGGGAPEG